MAMHEITRLDNYVDYEELKRDIEKDRLATRRSLKQFFNTFGDKHEWLAERIVKTLVHALAEEDLPPGDKRFFQALLYSRPEFINPHLIGGLNVGHKSKAGGEQRAKAIKQLLRRSQFANHQGTANNLIAALANPEIAERAVEVLSGRNHATQATSNNLIAALANPEIAERAVEVLSGRNHATQATSNNLIAALANPEI
ncbi:hypothetical protein HY995_03645, partial [Candidatus Micrarchaeota archaeon]|nr:hypothetical protein [Candidatus Micrarchaeota archaeon]